MNRHYIERAFAVLTLLLASLIATPAFAAFDDIYIDGGSRVSGAYGIGPGNYSYLVSNGENDTSSVIRRIAPDGTIDWETSFPGHSIYGSAIDANASRACVALLQGPDENSSDLTLIAQCFAVDDGATVWRADPIATALKQHRPLLHLSDANAVAVLYHTAGDVGRLRIARRGADGGEDPGLGLPANSFSDEATLSNDGSVLVYDVSSTTYTTRIVNLVSGAMSNPYNAATFGLAYSFDTMAPDGTVFLVGVQRIATIGSRTIAIKVSPNGTEVWRRVLREDEYFTLPPVFGDGAVFFALGHDAIPGDDFIQDEPPYASIALEYGTGVVRWDVDVPPARHAYFTGNVSADGDTLVMAQSLASSKIRVQTRNTATGAIVIDTEHECGKPSCTQLLSAVDATGTLRIIGRNNTDNTHAVFVKNDVTTTPLHVIVSNFGLKGGWSTGTHGQGLTIDIGPNASGGVTFFAPWFAMSYRPFTEPQSTNESDLHWYTLQADLPGDVAPSLAVTIYETSGGTFAAAGVVSPHRVGEGTISFTSCDEGALVYSFDAGHNGGAQGVVGLTRITPRTHSCTIIAANGDISLEEVDSSHEGEGGFSLDYSGTWSQVGASGQGLEFAVRPGELIAGAWFTFDTGSANDDQRHHWFTFDGSLANATNATATVTLYQTVGGTFDSRPAPATGTKAVGTATIRFLSCHNAELTYAFNGTVAGVLNLTGTIQLEHLSGCLEQ